MFITVVILGIILVPVFFVLMIIKMLFGGNWQKWAKLLAAYLCLFMVACFFYGTEESSSEDSTTIADTTNTEGESDDSSYDNLWELHAQLKNKGYSAQELEAIEDILKNVGITDYHDIDITDNNPMTIIRGYIYDDDQLQLNVILENKKVATVTLGGIPTDKPELYRTIFGNINIRHENGIDSVDLYSDTQGGYLAKLNWEKKEIKPM